VPWVVALLALLIAGSAAGEPDGGVADAPLADVVPVDGGYFLTDERMLIVGQHLARPCPVVEAPPATDEVKPFLYGVAAGAVVVAVAVVTAIIYGATR